MDKERRKAIQTQYTEKMVVYLPTLRSAAKITQNHLAKKIGVARSTVVAIESKNRKLQWYIYLAMVLVFMQNDDSKKLLESFGLFEESFIQEI
jgi:DNA-binding XRE family transcriptional regulator